MRNLPVWLLAVAAVILTRSSSTPAAAERSDSCAIAPFTWNIVGSNVTPQGRLVKVDFLAIGVASHSGPACSLAGEDIVVRDRAFVLFDPVCGTDGTTPLHGTDPLDYGSGVRMEFRGPITGVVTCGENGMRTLTMEIEAKSQQGARLLLRQTGEVDLAAKMMTRLAVTDGELALR